MTIEGEALAGLTSAFAALLPPPPAPELGATVAIQRMQTSPTGLGGFVATSDDPIGEITGLRLKADVQVTVRAADGDALGGAVATVTDALVGADGTSLRSQGILRLALAGLGARSSDGTASQDLTFGVLYEFLKRPETIEGGIIETIPIDVTVLRRLFSETFSASSLSQFEVIDDPDCTISTPSEWIFESAEDRIEQRSAILGGSFALLPNKPSTYLVLTSTPEHPAVADIKLTVEMESHDIDGIGLVFRFTDANNFYYLLMNKRRNHRFLGKKVDGTFSFLDSGGRDKGPSYTVDRRMEVQINADGPQIEVKLDGQLVLEARDESLTEAGRVGLLSHGNNAAYFYSMVLHAQ